MLPPDRLNGRQLLPLATKVLSVKVPIDINSTVSMEKFYFPDSPVLDSLRVVGISVALSSIDANYTFFANGNIENYIFTIVDKKQNVIFEKYPVKAICSEYTNPLPGFVTDANQRGKVLPLDMKIHARLCYVQCTNPVPFGPNPDFRNMEFLFYCL